MDKPNNQGKLIILAVIIVVAVALIIYYGAGTPAQTPGPGNATSTAATSTGTTGATSTAGQISGTSGTKSATSAKPPGTIITFVTPIPGETWTINQQNTVQWSRAGGVSGEIALLDASTKALVGVILPATGPQQTSYAWNTRDLLLSRTNPLKKNVAPGRYLVRVSWDGNNLPPITSQPITIVSSP